MRKALISLTLVLAFSSTASAQGFIHYIKTHKYPIVMSTIACAAQISVGFTDKREPAQFRAPVILCGGEIAANFLWRWHENKIGEVDSWERYLVPAMFTAPPTIVGIVQVCCVEPTEGKGYSAALAQARAKVMR